jgi:hypothetical protein
MMKGYNKVILSQTLAAVGLLLVMTFLPDLTPGWMTWGLAFPAWTIIGVTTLARAKDITANSKRWIARRTAMTLTGAGCTAMAAAPLLGYTYAYPTWYTVLTFWGLAGILVTSPQQPPWWKYINGEYKLKKGQQV